MSEKWQLIRAVYDYMGSIWNEVEDPERCDELEADEFILAIVREHKGHPVTCHEIHGDTIGLKHFAELDARLEKLKALGLKYSKVTEYYDSFIYDDWVEMPPFARELVNGIGREVLAIIEEGGPE